MQTFILISHTEIKNAEYSKLLVCKKMFTNYLKITKLTTIKKCVIIKM